MQTNTHINLPVNVIGTNSPYPAKIHLFITCVHCDYQVP